MLTRIVRALQMGPAYESLSSSVKYRPSAFQDAVDVSELRRSQKRKRDPEEASDVSVSVSASSMLSVDVEDFLDEAEGEASGPEDSVDEYENDSYR